MPRYPDPRGLRLPPPTLTSLLPLLDDVALVEHAMYSVPDPSSGHCADDAGRALALASTAGDDPAAGEIARRCLAFLEASHLGDGRFRVRDRERSGAEHSSDDGSGRAIHGLGVAAARAPWRAVRVAAARLFAEVVGFDSPHLRARAHALLGAAAITAAGNPPLGTIELVDRLETGLDGELGDDWPWPERRLTYSNAILVDARLAIASVRHDAGAIERALRALRWLVGIETLPGHFSPTPVGGWAAGEPRPGFDQQPLEAWAVADAAVRALELTGDAYWAEAVRLAAAWFAGTNDVGVLVWDPATGRSYDGLERHGVNRNQGAESALALVSTLRDLDRAPRLVGRGPAAGQAARSSSR